MTGPGVALILPMGYKKALIFEEKVWRALSSKN